MEPRGSTGASVAAAPPARRSSLVLDYAALAELRHQIRRFLAFSERKARAAGIEPQQHQLLLALKGLPEGSQPTIRALAERLVLKHHTTVGLVDRLVMRGLVARRPHNGDGRQILVEITPSGERVLRKLSLAHRAELSSVGPALAAALEPLLVESTPSRRSTRRTRPRRRSAMRVRVPR